MVNRGRTFDEGETEVIHTRSFSLEQRAMAWKSLSFCKSGTEIVLLGDAIRQLAEFFAALHGVVRPAPSLSKALEQWRRGGDEAL